MGNKGKFIMLPTEIESTTVFFFKANFNLEVCLIM